MGKQINSIEGIGPSLGAALRKAGVNTVDSLLDAGCNKKGRKMLAAKTKINEARLLNWVNMADLFRIRGVAGQYAELLKGSGVDTVKELRNRNAENLAAKMTEVNAKKELVRKVPTAKMVKSWVEQAKALPPKITH